MSKLQIGCCGAYCGTCKAMKDNACRGCKIGYRTGKRDISKAKCRIKVCCINKGFISCADCREYYTCDIIKEFLNHNGYKYKKYREAIEFIRNNSYNKFLKKTVTWSMQYGKYK